ncbi:DUF4139 domain-containing protein [Shimia aestuarii]|uniref:DUF4139 domain-containing protein n=1 Tax=Shimia aestuarii TaxID=254406 RepID=A0A1I4IEJ8_9RHOB|nr:DUF4139 domain-containing protein [Shimia aestuarii]SFL52176.1 conserved hypothetical protein [Shimia aestuarii]
MTKAFAALLFLPTALYAETIPLSTPVTEAVIYSQGATVTRTAVFPAPQGDHELLITGLPPSLDPHSVRVAIDGVTLGAVTVRQGRVLPVDTIDSPELTAAKAEVKRLEGEIETTRDAREDVLMRETAAQARITYLATLTGPTETAPSPETLQATLDLIAAQTLAAHQDAAAAQREARGFADTLKELTETLAKAQQTVDALTPPQNNSAMLAVTITAPEATTGTLTLTHLVHQAGWMPVYDVHLTHTDTTQLSLQRGAFVGQNTGEDWRDVAVTLSTSRPNDQTVPSPLYPERRAIYEKQERRAGATYDSKAAPAPESPVMAEAIAAPDFSDGINATYVYPAPVSLGSGDDNLRLSLDTLDTTPGVFALANPMRDETAFLMATLTNDTGETILPSYETSYYLNGQFISRGEMPLVAEGDTLDLSFGPINGLRLSQTVLDREAGDSGVLTSRNELKETRRFTIENLSNRSWDMRILGRVPYSEQEDLQITWQAKPQPDQVNHDDDRGILAWERVVPAGDSLDVTLSTHLKWPGDMELH